jgi:hypothetical protein
VPWFLQSLSSLSAIDGPPLKISLGAERWHLSQVLCSITDLVSLAVLLIEESVAQDNYCSLCRLIEGFRHTYLGA